MSNIQIYFEDIKPIKLKKNIIKKLIKQLINNELKKTGEISVIFCSDSFLLEMNKQYLEHDYFTDIITFDYVVNDVISGDLFISIDRIMENSEKFGNSFKNELIRVIFHGVLHLAGYKDKTESEQKLMRSKEDFYLKAVDFSEMEL